MTTIKPNVHFPRDVVYWLNVCFGRVLHSNITQKELLYTAGNYYFEQASEAFKQFGKDFNLVMQYLKKIKCKRKKIVSTITSSSNWNRAWT